MVFPAFRYFTEISVPETVVLPCEKPDIEDIISAVVDVQIISVRVAATPGGQAGYGNDVTSHEGQHLSGCKLIIELNLRQKIKYVADEPTQSVHAAHFEHVLHSVFIVVPCNIVTGDGSTIPIQDLLRLNKVVIIPNVEDVYTRLIDKRTIFKNITLHVEAKFRP